MPEMKRPDHIIPAQKMFVPDIEKDVLVHLKEMQRSGQYGAGPLLEQFSLRVADFLAQQHQRQDKVRGHVASRGIDTRPFPRAEHFNVIPVSSGTSALTLALKILIGEEKEEMAFYRDEKIRVLLPSMTFPATANAVEQIGYQVVFADVDPKTWLLTPEIAEQAMEKHNIHAVMPVAAYGAPTDYQAWDSFQLEKRIPVITDAAGAFGNQLIGDYGMTAFSLQVTKTLNVGFEGGMLVTFGGKGYLERLGEESRHFGMSRGEVVCPYGWNYNASEVHACFGLAALGHWPETANKYENIRMKYIWKLQEFDVDVNTQHTHHGPDGIISTLMPVLLPAGMDNRKTHNDLLERNIGTRSVYTPAVHLHPNFAQRIKEGRAHVAGNLEVTEELSRRLIGLPFHVYLQEQEIDYICHTLHELTRMRGKLDHGESTARAKDSGLEI